MPRPVSPAREFARTLYASQFDGMGVAWQNTANLIRTGFENLWITPAIDALEALVLLSGYEPDPDDD